jgi:hypothetical protein
MRTSLATASCLAMLAVVVPIGALHWFHQENEGYWVVLYLAAGLTGTLGAGLVLNALPRIRDRLDVFWFVVTYAAVYTAQVVGYVYLHHPLPPLPPEAPSHYGYLPDWYLGRVHVALLLPPVIGIAVLLQYVFSGEWNVVKEAVAVHFRPRSCATCGQPSRFVLTSDRPDRSGISKRYCFGHFLQALERSLTRYRGHFVMAAPQRSGDNRQAQYFFYAPQDMQLDSYDESDVNAVRSLIAAAFEGETKNGDKPPVVRIPGDALSRPATETGDAVPLLTRSIESIEKTPMSIRDLIASLRSDLSDFDAEGGQFQMNRPYAPRGIYVWCNYI